ncbi:unnamed protein product [Urochloa humidicola]
MAATALPVPAHKRPAPEEACAADAGKKKKRPRFELELEDINDYVMLEEVGEGASAVVAKARDSRTGETVAIKWIRGHEADDDDGGLRRAVLREAGCLAAGHGHPGVVRIRSVATDDDTGDMYIVTELAAGGSLRGRLAARGRPFSEDEARRAMRQLLGAAERLHAAGTIHCDINPDNILVGGGGDLKLCGFGSATTPAARCAGRRMCVNDKKKKPVGTLQYSAVEQLIRFSHHGPEADAWALGCVMAELLAGEPLFTAGTEDDMITEVVDLRDDFVTMGVEAFDGTALDHVSVAGREVLAGLLAYDSEDRLTAADALKHRWFAEEGVEVKPPAVEEE